MAQKIKGKCKFCGKQYTFAYMNKHLPTCQVRLGQLAAEKGMKLCGYYELAICFAYNRNYWMYIEMKETATLRDLDTFLRDIWMECCGHLSAFDINGVSYDIEPEEASMWGEPAKSMNYKLSTVLHKGLTFTYEYDFGSTTKLMITAVNYRVKDWKKEKIVILSRNNPHEYMCEQCGEKPATALCAICYCECGEGFLCEACSQTHSCGEEMMLTVCNSPRMGVCGYCGSSRYPDQFLSDVELDAQ